MLGRKLEAAIGLHIARLAIGIGLPISRLLSVDRLAIARVGGSLAVGGITARHRLAQLIEHAQIDGDGAFAGDYLLRVSRFARDSRSECRKAKTTEQPSAAKKRSVHGRPLSPCEYLSY